MTYLGTNSQQQISFDRRDDRHDTFVFFLVQQFQFEHALIGGVVVHLNDIEQQELKNDTINYLTL